MVPILPCQPTQDHNFLETLSFPLFLSLTYRILIYLLGCQLLRAIIKRKSSITVPLSRHSIHRWNWKKTQCCERWLLVVWPSSSLSRRATVGTVVGSVVVVRREGANFLASLLLSFSPLFFSSIVLADAGLLRAPIFAFPYLCSTSTFPKPRAAPGLRRWRLLVFLLREIGDLILNDTNNRFSYFYSISRDTKMICLNVRLNFL